MTSVNRNALWQLLFIILLASAVRFYKLGHAALWLDEALTINLSSLPLSVLWITPYDSNPPLFYSIIHFLLQFGHSETLLRTPSAIFGVLTIIVIYFTTRKVSGSLAAFYVALLLSLSFHNIEYGQEARAYALLGLCLSISFLGLINLSLRWKDTCSRFTFREFILCGGGLYALGLIAALYTHNIAVFYWLGAQVFFLAWWFRPFKFSLQCLVIWGALNSVVLFLWLPWMFASFQVMEKGIFSWLGQASPEGAFATWRAIHGFRTVDFAQPYADLLLLITGILGIYSLRKNLTIVALILGLLVCSSVVIWAYGLVSTPVFMLRTILWGSLFSAVLVGIGVSRLPKPLGAVLILAFLSAQSKGVYDYYQTNFAEGESWRDVAAVFNEHQKPNDILLIRNPYVSWPFFYYVEGQSENWDIYGWSCSDSSALSGKIENAISIKTIDWKPSDLSPQNPIPVKKNASLWVIESHCNPKDWTEADALFFPGWRLQTTYGFKRVYLHLLVPPVSG